jgi:hypothetical protein
MPRQILSITLGQDPEELLLHTISDNRKSVSGTKEKQVLKQIQLLSLI